MGKSINEEPINSESERAASYLSFLVKAVQQIGTTLDYEETLTQIAKAMVPELSDWCGVDILQEDGQIKRLAVAHVDPKKVVLAEQLSTKYPPKPNAKGGSREVLRTGETIMINGITDDLLVDSAVDDNHLRIMRELELHSLIVVPIKSRNKTLGTLTLVWSKLGHNYSLADVAFAETLASVAGSAIDNSRLYHKAVKKPLLVTV